MERAFRSRRRQGRVDSAPTCRPRERKVRIPMEFNMTQWLQEILEADARLAMPITTSPGMELIGKPLGELFTDGQVQSECMRRSGEEVPVDRGPHPDGPLGRGRGLRRPGEVLGHRSAHGHRASVVTDLASIEALPVPDGGSRPHLASTSGPPVWPAGRSSDRPMLGGMIGPFSLACRLMDMSEADVGHPARPRPGPRPAGEVHASS